MSILEKFSLAGKAAYVTGGAQGIGKSVATAFAEAGADVAIVDINIAKAEETAAEIAKATGRDIIAIKADVTVPEDVDAFIKTVKEHYGKIDVAFNNAGICINAPADEMTYEQWSKVINVNLNGVFLTAQAAAKVMLEQGYGSIINTASMSGHIVNVPQPQCAYNASKAAVIMLTKSMAVEFASKNVRVNCISPGYIGTDLVLTNEALIPLIEKWNAMSPIGRLGHPDELQAICVYLASDASPFTTGSDFIVDGGFTSF